MFHNAIHSTLNKPYEKTKRITFYYVVGHLHRVHSITLFKTFEKLEVYSLKILGDPYHKACYCCHMYNLYEIRAYTDDPTQYDVIITCQQCQADLTRQQLTVAHHSNAPVIVRSTSCPFKF